MKQRKIISVVLTFVHFICVLILCFLASLTWSHWLEYRAIHIINDNIVIIFLAVLQTLSVILLFGFLVIRIKEKYYDVDWQYKE